MEKLIAPLLLFGAMLIPVTTFPTCIIILRDTNGDLYIVADKLATGTRGDVLRPLRCIAIEQLSSKVN